MVRRDDDACALCDKYREDEKERDADNEKDHDDMRRDIAAMAKREDLKNIEEATRRHVPWPTFAVLIVLTAGLGGWFANDHVGISRQVVVHEEIIKNHAEYIKEDRDMKRVFYENQVALMTRFGVEPKPLPEQLSK